MSTREVEVARKGAAAAAARERGLATKRLREQREARARALQDQPVFTAEDLLSVEFPPIHYVIDELLPIGLTHFSGAPKVGKSYLVLQAGINVATGTPFLGRDVESGKVLYLALEDNERRLQDRLRELGASSGLAGLDLAVVWQPFMNRARDGGARRAAGLRDLERRLEAADKPPQLVIVDTLAQVLPGLNHDDYSVMTAALTPLHRLALKHEIAICLVDHQNKGARRNDLGPDLATDALGSTAKAGSADTLWGLYGATSDKPARLLAKGREVEALEIPLARHESHWIVREDKRTTARTDGDEAIIHLLEGAGCAMSVEAIAQKLGRERSTVQRRVRRMTDDDKLTSTGRSTKNGSEAIWYSLP
jgi:RecA-family ATPase